MMYLSKCCSRPLQHNPPFRVIRSMERRANTLKIPASCCDESGREADFSSAF